MGKTERFVAKAAFGLTKAVTKPLFDRMAKETREWNRRYDQMIADIERGLALNPQPRVLEVHQLYDPIIHEDDFF